MTKYFHARVKTELVYDSDARAKEIADQASKQINELGGGIEVGPMFGNDYAFLIVKLPDDVSVYPDELVPGQKFSEVHAATVQAVEDQNIHE